MKEFKDNIHYTVEGTKTNFNDLHLVLCFINIYMKLNFVTGQRRK